jgi:hypothetical protein
MRQFIKTKAAANLPTHWQIDEQPGQLPMMRRP